MFNPHTKYEASTITCYEGMKGNAKCRNCGGGMSTFNRAHTTS